MTSAITVEGEHPYQVMVGRALSSQVPGLLGSRVHRVLLMHAQPLTATAQGICADLAQHGYQVITMAIPDGEAAKTAQVLTQAWSVLGRAAFGRDDVVIGLGGGATTDLAGFVAATWLRGVRVLHMPTTLLGMVDAAVGGKTGINTAEGKNLVGAFHSPVAVLCDLDLLRTLPPADLRAGLAEVIKCGFIADPQILDIVEEDPVAVIDPAAGRLSQVVQRAIQVKADVVSADLRESHLREVLNYGHTLAHAIEHAQQYRWRHGDAVAVGMVYAAELAWRAGLLGNDVVERHRSILSEAGLPTSYAGADWTILYDTMRRDKKTRGDTLRFVVLDAIGSPRRLEGPDPELLRAAYAAVSQ
ncbi:MAG: 3-dehydroquinate synthase [Beutenbergiaceae bacterium]